MQQIWLKAFYGNFIATIIVLNCKYNKKKDFYLNVGI